MKVKSLTNENIPVAAVELSAREIKALLSFIGPTTPTKRLALSNSKDYTEKEDEMKTLAITDSHVIKQAGNSIYSLLNFITGDETVLEDDLANIFSSELDYIFNSTIQGRARDSRLDGLCDRYL